MTSSTAATDPFGNAAYADVFERVESVRSQRDLIVEAVRSGELQVAVLLTERASEPIIASMKVLPWLEAAPGLGKVASRRLLASMDVADDSLTSALENHQIEQILQAIDQASS